MSRALQNKLVTIFGGTGFIGRYIVSQLAREGATIKIVTRHPSSAYFLRQFGSVGQIVPVLCNYSDVEIEKEVAGSDYVVNCLGILFEKKRGQFKQVHEHYADVIAKACASSGVQRLVHISAAGIDSSKSNYAETKRAGESAVRAAYPAATILRPSVVFGPEDQFFNKFAKLSLFMPALPIIGGGESKLQPVYAGDVAGAVLKAITLPEFGATSPFGKTYELGGPEKLTLGEVYAHIFERTKRKRMIFKMPELLARIQAAFFSILPNPPLTNDQITSLKTDNIVGADALALKDLGLNATAIDAVLPDYLDRYRAGGRFADKKRA